MPVITVVPRGDGVWPDLEELAEHNWVLNAMGNGTRWSLAALARGTTGGRPSVTLRLDLPDGRVVVAETTLRALVAAVRALVAVHGDPEATDPAAAPKSNAPPNPTG